MISVYLLLDFFLKHYGCNAPREGNLRIAQRATPWVMLQARMSP